jgi:hypothetical protein
MITKEAIKKEVDKLPDSLLEVVYRLLKSLTYTQGKGHKEWTTRNFDGKFDAADIRTAAYE